MKRRAFMQMSLAAAGATVTGTASGAAESNTTELYELRVYSLASAKQPTLDHYLSEAFLPALKQYGVGPVGVFLENVNENQRRVYVLIVHRSMESVATLAGRLAADETYRKAAAEYLSAPASAPVYDRIDSALLAAIEGMPRLVVPDTSKPRLLNLRVYESHNERAGKKKIEMFNKAELAIFRRVGLTPVLFAETIVGANMPNLTYLLVFPDEAARTAAWNRFRNDPDWQKLRAVPEYADKEIVSRITNKVLTPASYSGI